MSDDGQQENRRQGAGRQEDGHRNGSHDDARRRERLVLIDGSGYIFRAYHALPPLTRPDGTPVNAVYGFSNMLYKLIDDMLEDGVTTHVAVIFDSARKTFRSDIYPEYKAQRPPPPEDLVPQFPLIREAVRAFGIPALEMEGYEADDIIATYARRAREAGMEAVIVSSDKDLMQLVGDGVVMLDPMKNRLIDAEQVREKFGVPPEKVVDVQALAGDSVDNVPGVPGIGVKTAALLINQYGDLENLLAHAEEIPQKKRRENLLEYADLARISRKLVQLCDKAPVDDSIASTAISPPDPKVLIPFLSEQGFNSLLAKARARFGGSGGGDGAEDGTSAEAENRIITAERQYQTIFDIAELQRWADEARRQGYVAIDTETTGLDAMQAALVGVSLALAPGRACYIPLAHRQAEEGGDGGLDFGGGGKDDGGNATEARQIPLEAALEVLRPLLSDPGVLKIGQNLKYDDLLLSRHGIRITPLDDTMVISFVLFAGLHGHGMDELSERYLGVRPIPIKELIGSGRKQITFDLVPIDKAAEYAAEDADITLRLHQILKPRLVREHMVSVYETIERPLLPVLVDMERAGVRVDRMELAALSEDFSARARALEKEIHKLAGEEFNIASPKQLGEILFTKLGLEGGKKGKTGAYGTGHDVLEKLAAEGHELPARVLEWRALTKLKSTYTDALQKQINPQTGRVHTSYSMVGAATGRLSSTDPNLQNIPIRTEDGRKIRRAFVAEEGNRLISADYSQIELRILAHVANIDSLKQAFHEGIDIHALTASQVFGIPVENMDPMIRRSAKAINFGIIYGISAFGLARQLGISRSDAQKYIDTYFKRYPGIREYMDRTVETCRKQGYVETVYGRRCHLPGINDRNPMRRNFAERAAINAPIQGTAADVIKRAMIRLPERIREAGLDARMLLQVHDELVFEAPADQAEAVAALAREVMEGAARLSVPLEVETGIGQSWAEAH